MNSGTAKYIFVYLSAVEIRLPIALSDLPQALDNLRRDDNRGFQVEYQVSGAHAHTHDASLSTDESIDSAHSQFIAEGQM